jgi:hypothetical protein
MAQSPALGATGARIITSSTLSKPLSRGCQSDKAQYRNPDARAARQDCFELKALEPTNGDPLSE